MTTHSEDRDADTLVGPGMHTMGDGSRAGTPDIHNMGGHAYGHGHGMGLGPSHAQSSSRRSTSTPSPTNSHPALEPARA